MHCQNTIGQNTLTWLQVSKLMSLGEGSSIMLTGSFMRALKLNSWDWTQVWTLLIKGQNGAMLAWWDWTLGLPEVLIEIQTRQTNKALIKTNPYYLKQYSNISSWSNRSLFFSKVSRFCRAYPRGFPPKKYATQSFWKTIASVIFAIQMRMNRRIHTHTDPSLICARYIQLIWSAKLTIIVRFHRWPQDQSLDYDLILVYVL